MFKYKWINCIRQKSYNLIPSSDLNCNGKKSFDDNFCKNNDTQIKEEGWEGRLKFISSTGK